MTPDYLFVVPAILIMLWSTITVAKQRDKLGLHEAAIWMLLGIGLLLQGLAPHLEISGRVVVVPVTNAGGIPKVQLGLIQKERVMMTASSICIVVSLIALGLKYKPVLIGTVKPVPAEQ